MVAGRLTERDFITSNHRCHGHFIAATGNWHGLIDEIVGNARGVCSGVGSRQHLYATNFLSNGPQGALLPVAAGVGLDRRTRGRSEEHTSELQSLMRISYAVFCLKKKQQTNNQCSNR